MSDLDTLLDEIGNYNNPTVNIPFKESVPPTPAVIPTDDNLNDYILRQASALVEMSIDSVKELKDFVLQGTNPEEIAALAELVNASSKAIENINKLNLQKRKFDNDIKLKSIDYQFKKELASIESKPQTVNNTLLIASREEIFKKFINNKDDVVTVDITAQSKEEPLQVQVSEM